MLLRTACYPPYKRNQVGHYIVNIVDALLSQDPRSRSENEGTLRACYTESICNAMAALELTTLDRLFRCGADKLDRGLLKDLSAAAAAVGSESVFDKLVKGPFSRFNVDESFFPDALTAAVAAGQIKMVRSVLARIRLALDNGTCARWAVDKGICRAVKIGLRTHQAECVKLVLEAAVSFPQVRAQAVQWGASHVAIPESVERA